MLYQLGWATLPGLRGLSVSEFRATPASTPDNERGVAIKFTSETERDAFLQGPVFHKVAGLLDVMSEICGEAIILL